MILPAVLQTKVFSITLPELVTFVEMPGLVSCGAFSQAGWLCTDSACPLACGTYFFEGCVHTLAQL